MISEGNEQDKVLYIYEIMAQRYLGFINLSTLLGMPTRDLPLDFTLMQDSIKGGLCIVARDTMYLLS